MKIVKLVFGVLILGLEVFSQGLQWSQYLNEYHENIRYASHVFKPGHETPIKSFEREPSEEKQLEKIINNRLTNAIVDGDVFVYSDRKRTKRKILNEYEFGKPTRWPNKTIPYEYDPKFSKEMRKLFERAMDHWQTFTCVKFEVFDRVKHSNYRSYIYVQNSDICGSSIGYVIDNRQRQARSNMYLSRDCAFGNIVHELGHVIGFRHEHSRTDRDDHIFINFKSISKSLQGQYMKGDASNTNYYNVPYDLSSIMHYASIGVISALDARRSFLMGQRVKLSFLDIQMANAAYKCNDKCPKNIVCENSGFVNKNCECFCPRDFFGTRCEKIKDSFLDTSQTVNMNSIDKSINCSFSGDSYCSWQNDLARAKEMWYFNRDEDGGFTQTQVYFSKLTEKFKTGPQTGDRFKNPYGKYICTNSLKKTKPFSNAILTSPKMKLTTATRACLTMWYNMYCSNDTSLYPLRIGNLSVNVRGSDGGVEKVWSREKSQGVDWHEARIDLRLKPPYSSIFIEAFFDDYYYGDICIDDIDFKKGSCDQIVVGWTDWSDCSVTCGKGVQYRSRTCASGEDSRGPVPCLNGQVESRECDKGACPIVYFSPWSEWSKCTDPPDSYRYRVRECLRRDIPECRIGELTQYELCGNNSALARDEVLGLSESESWTEWTKCRPNQLCDEGIQVRKKTCLAEICVGPSIEVRKCNLTLETVKSCTSAISTLTELSFSCTVGLKVMENFVQIGDGCVIGSNNSTNYIIRLMDESNDTKNGSFRIIESKLKEPHSIRLKVNWNGQNHPYYCLNVRVKKKYDFEMTGFYDSKGSRLRSHLLSSFFDHDFIVFTLQINNPIENFILIEFDRDTNQDLDEIVQSVFITKDKCPRLEESLIAVEPTWGEQIRPKAYQIGSKDNLMQKILQMEDDFISGKMKCGGIYDLAINKTIFISSPYYPQQYPTNIVCNYFVKSPIGTKINLEALDFDLEHTQTNTCLDGLELRYYHLGQPGPVYCGTTTGKSRLTLKSYFNFLFLTFRSEWAQTVPRRGFNIRLDFS